jgi:hypothetical protein
VPIVRDGRTVVFETDEDSQVIAKYSTANSNWNLFPKQFRGVDRILWRFIEDQSKGLLPAQRHLLGGVRAQEGTTGLPAPQGEKIRPRLPGPMARPASALAGRVDPKTHAL